jgi:hypothetical protein
MSESLLLDIYWKRLWQKVVLVLKEKTVKTEDY